jgi:hypothetical protein
VYLLGDNSSLKLMGAVVPGAVAFEPYFRT